MGYAKDQRIQEDEQGWKFSPGVHACHRCLTDDDLSAYVRSNARYRDCSFCERTTKRPSSITFDALMEILWGTMSQYYEPAVGALGWVDGDYFGTTYSATDLLYEDLGSISENQKLLNHLREVLGDELWCERSPYSITGYEAYETGWEQFCDAVKYQTRYFFTRQQAGDETDSEVTPVPAMLEEISTLLEQEGLIITTEPNVTFARVRVHHPDEHCEDWQSLGPPPRERAPSNRMSAAGISMFYASTEEATAIAEARASVAPGAAVALTSASWTPTRQLQLLDLTRIRPTPSFWFTARYDRDRIRFLNAFTESITQPVVHDGREHIEYVPTQILTEYFRHEYQRHDGTTLDGIKYPSAQRRGATNVVIFATQADLTPANEQRYTHHPPLLALNTESIRRRDDETAT